MTHQAEIHLARIIELAGKIAPLIAARHPLGMRLAEELEILHERDVAPHFDEARRERNAAAAVRRKEATDRMKIEGPKLWEELHRRALQPVADEAAERLWLEAYTHRLPCGSCRTDFRKLLISQPPIFAAYFHWSVDIHNAINAQLGKPAMTHEHALRLWLA